MNSKYSGINVCCRDPRTNTIVGTPYPKDGLVSDNIELAYRYHIVGEHWGAVRLDLLKELPFPQTHSHYYNEGYLWYSLALKGYKVVCYNKMMRDYFFEPSSLTNNNSYRFNRDTISMNIKDSVWKIKKAGRMIRKYSISGYLRLYENLAKHIIKYVISILYRPAI